MAHVANPAHACSEYLRLHNNSNRAYLNRDLPIYDWTEIMKHDNDKDCWVVLNDYVLDVTKFLGSHPGGSRPIRDLAGFDITADYLARGHSSRAEGLWPQLVIGLLDKTSARPTPKPASVNVAKPKIIRQYFIWIFVALVVLAVCSKVM